MSEPSVRIARKGFLVLLVAALSVVSGCTPASTPAETPSAVAEIPIADTCEDVSDVLTLWSNLRMANLDGRLADDDFLRSAGVVLSRVVDSVNVESRTDLSSALVDLRDALKLSTDSEALSEAIAQVSQTCEAGGSELIIQGWTGG